MKTLIAINLWRWIEEYRQAFEPLVPQPPSHARADFILVYGMQPRRWMPAYAGMTIKRSFPRKRESRGRTYNGKPL